MSRFHHREPPPCYVMQPDRSKQSFFILEFEPKYLFIRRFGDRAGDILMRIVEIVSQEMPNTLHLPFDLRMISTQNNFEYCTLNTQEGQFHAR